MMPYLFAFQVRVDAAQFDNQVYVFGFNGPTVQCMSVKQLQNLQAQLGLATVLYVFTVVPAVSNAPHFPLLAILHNGSRKTFTIALILNMWQLLWQVGCMHPVRMCLRYWLYPQAWLSHCRKNLAGYSACNLMPHLQGRTSML